ncbi:MAG: hypothetical protein WC824_08250 [Bacteroidota bacterium]|jgi:hypothetical protein
MLTAKEQKLKDIIAGNRRDQAVCRRCNTIMRNYEPSISGGEYFHKTTFANGKTNPCPNAGRTFQLDRDSKEVMLWVPKKQRRLAKRLGVETVD